MPNLLYQTTVVTRGWNGPGQKWPKEAVKIGREKAKELKLDGPFHFRGEPKHLHTRDEIFDLAVERLRKAKPGDLPIVVMSDRYDEDKIGFRAIKDVPETAPWVKVIETFEVPCTEYTFGAIPVEPCPTGSDCSGAVVRGVGEAKGIWLPHSAAAIWADPRIDRFFDPDNAESGDFVFYYFGSDRRPADDIATVYGDEKPGMQIGARPSTKPGYPHDGIQIWRMDAPGEESHRIGFGRLRAA